MKRLRFSFQAVRDLYQIWSYSERRWGKQQAIRYTSDIESMAKLLVSDESRGRLLELCGVRFRRARSGSHVISPMMREIA